jgi:20S proteasome alpha/beta subunit
MTIAVGILCADGAVVGAEREISTSTFKTEEPKTFLLKRNNVRIGLVGAGSFSLIKLAHQELEQRLTDDMTKEQVKQVASALVREIHVQHVQTNPNANHYLDLLLAIKTTPKSGMRERGLLKFEGTVPNWVDRYAAIGYGHELANYLLKQSYTRAQDTSVLRGIMQTAHVLDEVKANTHYSGGQSDIIHVRLGWVSGFVPEEDTALYEHTARRFAEIARPVMMALSDINVSGTKLTDLIGKMSVELHSFRPQAFLDAQAALQKREHEAAQIHQQDSSSMVFGVMETSAPPYQK